MCVCGPGIAYRLLFERECLLIMLRVWDPNWRLHLRNKNNSMNKEANGKVDLFMLEVCFLGLHIVVVWNQMDKRQTRTNLSTLLHLNVLHSYLHNYWSPNVPVYTPWNLLAGTAQIISSSFIQQGFSYEMDPKERRRKKKERYWDIHLNILNWQNFWSSSVFVPGGHNRSPTGHIFSISTAWIAFFSSQKCISE